MICTLRVTLIFICDIISNGNASLIDFNNSMPTPDRRIRVSDKTMGTEDLPSSCRPNSKGGMQRKKTRNYIQNQMKRMRLHTDLDQIPILCKVRSKA